MNGKSTSLMQRVLHAGVLCLLFGCAIPLKVYTGLDLPDEQLALLDWSACHCVHEIDGMKLHIAGLFPAGRMATEQAKLLPGMHTIRFGWEMTSTAVLDMKAGRIYAVHGRSGGGRGLPYAYLWIEDQKTGEVMHGVRPGSH